jgi:xylulokinase
VVFFVTGRSFTLLGLLAGSRSLERYTGPQIRRIFETQKEIYHATERVSLISSFMASLLLGDYAAIDHSDAAGMTLMDLHHRTWSPDALHVSLQWIIIFHKKNIGCFVSQYF